MNIDDTLMKEAIKEIFDGKVDTEKVKEAFMKDVDKVLDIVKDIKILLERAQDLVQGDEMLCRVFDFAMYCRIRVMDEDAVSMCLGPKDQIMKCAELSDALKEELK